MRKHVTSHGIPNEARVQRGLRLYATELRKQGCKERTPYNPVSIPANPLFSSISEQIRWQTESDAGAAPD